MNKNMMMVGALLLVIGVAGLLAVAFYGSSAMMSGTSDYSFRNDIVYPGTMMGNLNRGVSNELMGNMMTDFSKSSYASNGERIYLSSTGSNGQRLQATFDNNLVPMRGMMARHVACVNCHGENGKGGFVFPDGTTESADIRWSALEDEGFDADSFKAAVTGGKDEKGDALSPWMPLWTIGDEDLADLMDYLKTL
jgi:mono/diheme cytochrome c family protein